MRYIAYKETTPFWILEPPESIRALALYLLYKELGVAAEPYGAEFARITEPVWRARPAGSSFGRYKERNPATLSEDRAKAPGPRSLCDFLEGLHLYDRDPQFREEVERLTGEPRTHERGLFWRT